MHPYFHIPIPPLLVGIHVTRLTLSLLLPYFYVCICFGDPDSLSQGYFTLLSKDNSKPFTNVLDAPMDSSMCNISGKERKDVTLREILTETDLEIRKRELLVSTPLFALARLNKHVRPFLLPPPPYGSLLCDNVAHINYHFASSTPSFFLRQVYLAALVQKNYPSVTDPFASAVRDLSKHARSATIALAVRPNERKPAPAGQGYVQDLYDLVTASILEESPKSIPSGEVKVGKLKVAMHQSTQAPGVDAKTKVSQEWFTSIGVIEGVAPDSSVVKVGEKEEAKGDEEEVVTGIETALAELKKRKLFGEASTLIVQSTAKEPKANSSDGPTLGESVLQTASKKALQWKAELQRHRARTYVGFGGQAVKFLHDPSGFTPTFAPTHDSSKTSSGWGYDTTIYASKVLAQNNRFRMTGGSREFARDWEGGLYDDTSLEITNEDTMTKETGDIVSDGKSRAKEFVAELLGLSSNEAIDPELLSIAEKTDAGFHDLQRKLDQNAEFVEELTVWQNVRFHRGTAKPEHIREKMLVAKLEENLQALAGDVTPASLLPELASDNDSDEPFAVRTAKRLISTDGPNIRGTLDPKQPRALSDNRTLKPRPASEIAATPSRAAAQSPLPPVKPSPAGMGTPNPLPNGGGTPQHWQRGVGAATPVPPQPPTSYSGSGSPMQQLPANYIASPQNGSHQYPRPPMTTASSLMYSTAHTPAYPSPKGPRPPMLPSGSSGRVYSQHQQQPNMSPHAHNPPAHTQARPNQGYLVRPTYNQQPYNPLIANTLAQGPGGGSSPFVQVGKTTMGMYGSTPDIHGVNPNNAGRMTTPQTQSQAQSYVNMNRTGVGMPAPSMSPAFPPSTPAPALGQVVRGIGSGLGLAMNHHVAAAGRNPIGSPAQTQTQTQR